MTVWDWLIVIGIVAVVDIVLAPLRLNERSAAAGARLADWVIGLVKRDRKAAAPIEAPTFHHEPHPTLPGVVTPVLDQPVRMDPETGAVEWESDDG